MSSLDLDEYISKSSIPELLELINRVTAELEVRYMIETGQST